MVLDPATGKPMPGSPSFSETQFLEPTCPSNSACPESGYWKIMWSGEGRYVLLDRNVARYFKQGEIMPEARFGFYRKRLLPTANSPSMMTCAIPSNVLRCGPSRNPAKSLAMMN